MEKIAQAADVRWRTASTGNQTCVEVSHTLMAVRDSKAPGGPVLCADARALVSWARVTD